MSSAKKQQKTNWIGGAIRHLEVLCKEAAERAGEDEIAPSDTAKTAAIEILKQCSHAPSPTIGVTDDGEIVLTWRNSGDSFAAYVSYYGKLKFYRNQTLVERAAFAKNLTAVPA
jgi:hypothetical protein